MNNGYIASNPQIEHVAIFALEMEKLKSWYQRMFGFSSICIDGKETTFIKASNGMILEFMNAESDEKPTCENICGFRHIAFSVESFDGIEERLEKESIDIIRKSISPSEDTKMLFFHDPEKNVIQIVYRKKTL